MCEVYAVTCAVLDPDAEQVERILRLEGPVAIDWRVEPGLGQIVGRFDLEAGGQTEAREALAKIGRSLAETAPRRALVFEVHSIGRFGGHFGFSIVPEGYCRGCGRPLAGGETHPACRTASRDEARALADALVMGGVA